MLVRRRTSALTLSRPINASSSAMTSSTERAGGSVGSARTGAAPPTPSLRARRRARRALAAVPARSGCPGRATPACVHRLQQPRAVRIDRVDLVRRRNEVGRRGHVCQPHGQLVVAVAPPRAVLAIGLHSRSNSTLGPASHSSRLLEQVGLANVSGAGDQRRLEQRPDRVEVCVELAVGQPAVGGDDRGDQVAGLDHRVGRVRLGSACHSARRARRRCRSTNSATSRSIGLGMGPQATPSRPSATDGDPEPPYVLHSEDLRSKD